MNIITWLAVKTFLKKAWAWCKKYWQLLVGASIPVVVWLLTRKSGDLSEVLDRVREDHKKELDVIQKAHDKEIEDRDNALKKYKDAMSAVEKAYEQKEQELTKKKRVEISKALKEHSVDPDALTKKIAEITGMDIYIE